MTLAMVMGWYIILLTDVANKLCTITTPFGKYKYNRLTIGLYIVPDIFQDQMSALMDDLEFVRIYITVCSLLHQAHLWST